MVRNKKSVVSNTKFEKLFDRVDVPAGAATDDKSDGEDDVVMVMVMMMKIMWRW